jgi:hypothetical protein
MRRLCTLASVAFAFSGSGIAAELTAEISKDDAAFITKAITAAPAAIGQKATGTSLCQIGQPSWPGCIGEIVR